MPAFPFFKVSVILINNNGTQLLRPMEEEVPPCATKPMPKGAPWVTYTSKNSFLQVSSTRSIPGPKDALWAIAAYKWANVLVGQRPYWSGSHLYPWFGTQWLLLLPNLHRLLLGPLSLWSWLQKLLRTLFFVLMVVCLTVIWFHPELFTCLFLQWILNHSLGCDSVTQSIPESGWEFTMNK